MSEPKFLTPEELEEHKSLAGLFPGVIRLYGHIGALDAQIAQLQIDKEWFEEFACSCSSGYICQAHEDLPRSDRVGKKDQQMAALREEVENLKDDVGGFREENDRLIASNAAMKALVASDERDALIVKLTDAYAALREENAACRQILEAGLDREKDPKDTLRILTTVAVNGLAWAREENEKLIAANKQHAERERIVNP